MCRRQIGRWLCCLIVSLAFVSGGVVMYDSSASAAEEGQPPSKKPPETIRLDLKMERGHGKDLLRVTVTNVGKSPIVVDRKLIFGLNFDWKDNRGDDAPEEPTQKQPSRRPWTITQWKERMLTLQPGQSVNRIIDLYEEGCESYSAGRITSMHPPVGPVGGLGIMLGTSRVNKEGLEGPGRHLRYIWAKYDVTEDVLLMMKSIAQLDTPGEELHITEARRGLDLDTGKMFGIEEYRNLPESTSSFWDEETMRLDMKAEHEHGKDLLRVTLTNISKEPIVVDGKLVWGLSFELGDSANDDAPIEGLPHEFPPSRPWTVAQWKERVVTLQPGKSVNRVIDLHGGYESHDLSPYFMRGLPAKGVRTMERVNKQTLDKQERRLGRIWVYYCVTGNTLWRLKKITGLEAPVETMHIGDTQGGFDFETGRMYDWGGNGWRGK